MLFPIRSKLLRNATSLTATQLSGTFVRFAYMLAISRLLGPEEIGIYLYGVALYLGVMGIANFGQNVFLVQRIGKHKGMPLFVLHHSLTLTLIVTLIVTAGLVLFVVESENDLSTRLMILCFVGAMPARALSNWVRSIYVAIERPSWLPKYEIVFRTSEAISGIAMLLAGEGLFAICFLHFFFWALEAAFTLRKLAREHPGAVSLGWRWHYLRMIASSSFIHLIAVTAIALFLQISIVLLRNMQSSDEFVGHFGIAMQFMAALMIAPIAVAGAFFPRLSRSYAQGGGKDLITAAKLTGLLALAIAVTAAAYGPWFIKLVLGPRYFESAEIFRWLCWVFTPYCVATFLCMSLNFIGEKLYAAGISVAMVVIHASLLIIFLEPSPQFAAVFSLLTASVSGMIVALYKTSQKLAPGKKWWWLKLLVVITATFAIFENGSTALETTAPFALIAAALLTWKLKIFSEQEQTTIRKLF